MATWATHLAVLRNKLQDEGTDSDNQYWPDDELLGYGNLVMREIARKARWDRQPATADSVVDQAVYDLPEACWELVSVRYDGRRLEKIASNKLDAISTDWQTTPGTPAFFVRDELPETQIRLYPVPDEAVTDGIAYVFNALPTLMVAGTSDVYLPMESDQVFYDGVMAKAYAKEVDRQNEAFHLKFEALYQNGIKELAGRRAEDVEEDLLDVTIPIGML